MAISEAFIATVTALGIGIGTGVGVGLKFLTKKLGSNNANGTSKKTEKCQFHDDLVASIRDFTDKFEDKFDEIGDKMDNLAEKVYTRVTANTIDIVRLQERASMSPMSQEKANDIMRKQNR